MRDGMRDARVEMCYVIGPLPSSRVLECPRLVGTRYVPSSSSKETHVISEELGPLVSCKAHTCMYVSM